MEHYRKEVPSVSCCFGRLWQMFVLLFLWEMCWSAIWNCNSMEHSTLGGLHKVWQCGGSARALSRSCAATTVSFNRGRDTLMASSGVSCVVAHRFGRAEFPIPTGAVSNEGQQRARGPESDRERGGGRGVRRAGCSFAEIFDAL